MPQGSANIVSDDSKADILAYILQRNSFPPGKTELTTNTARLDTMQILRKGTAPGLQNLSFVQVVGCLEPGPGNRWVLTHSSARPGTRERGICGRTRTRADRALGEDTYTLVSAAPFAPGTRRGHKVAAKGLLYRQPGDYRVNVTALETLANSSRTSELSLVLMLVVVQSLVRSPSLVLWSVDRRDNDKVQHRTNQGSRRSELAAAGAGGLSPRACISRRSSSAVVLRT